MLETATDEADDRTRVDRSLKNLDRKWKEVKKDQEGLIQADRWRGSRDR